MIVAAQTGALAREPVVAAFNPAAEPPTPGIYRYHCDVHPSMKGSFIVTP